MPHVHRRHLLFAGLMIAGTGAPAATAQEAPAASAPLPAPTLPGAVAEGVLPAGPFDSPPTAVPPAGTCTCGNRHGLSRWRWHRTQCKQYLQEHFLGYAEEFNEWPLGEAAYAHARTQVANGLAARMVFYHYDFVDGTSQLNLRGCDKLAAVAATLPTTFFPVVVERTPTEPGLDQSRRLTLLTQLAQGSFPVPAERVVIGPRIANGMTGFEASTDLPAPVVEPQLGRMARRTRRQRVRRRRPGVRRWRPLGIGRHRRGPVRSVGPEGITQEGSGTMTGLRRTPRIGKVLAAGALIGLAGCHQVPSRPGAPSPLGFGNEPKGGGTTITPAQEADVQISMGRVAEQQGDLDQAMAAYRAALDRDKSRADAYARLAILHDKQGKFRESADLYRKALALRPGDPDIFCDMGYSFYLQRRWAEAEMNLRQSLAVNPEHRRAHNNLALLLVRDNRLGDALAEFGKAGSDPVQAHMNLAFALTIDQRWESARAEYQRAWRSIPPLNSRRPVSTS